MPLINTVKKVSVYYATITKQLNPKAYDILLKKLPAELIKINQKYKRWEDRHLHLFGKLLLIDALVSIGIDANKINNLAYTKHGKPFIPNENIDFNISHAGNYVVCAIGKAVQLGIDIELCKDMELSNFNIAMTEQEWEIIKTSDNPVEKFYTYWTIKESVLKADSRGISTNLLDIDINNNKNTAIINGVTWHLYEINLTSTYIANLTVSEANLDIELNLINYE